MRKITKESIHYFENKADFKKQNMEVESTENTTTLYLHGNAIARIILGRLYVSDGGYQSVTTKERLNGINGVHVQQKKGQWYLNGEKWNGTWTKVKR